MLNIALIGASGKAGQIILKEALSRNDLKVTAIVRNKKKITQAIPVVEKDIKSLTRDDLKDFDVVISAYGASPGNEEEFIIVGKVLTDALTNTKTRLVVVGGAGSLFVDEAKTTRLFETESFPKEYYGISTCQAKNLESLLQTKDLNWTFLSPAAVFDAEGERTGEYKLGKDNLILNSKNESYISYADYAIALIDEVEDPKHINTRFTVVSV